MVAVVIGFSIGSPFVRKVGAPGPVVAFWRMLLTAGAWQILLYRKGRRVNWAMLRTIGPLGVVFAANIVMFFTAATRTRIANVEMIGSTAPLIVFPLAAVLYGERVRIGALLLGLPAFAGVALVLFSAPSGSGTRSSLAGNVMAFGAVGLWSTYLLLSRRIRGRYDATEFMATVSLIALPLILPVALAQGSMHVRPVGWLFLGALTITAGTSAHGLLQWASQRIPISTISMMQVAQPALAIVWAFLILGESIRPLQLVGVIVVMVSLALFTWVTTRSSGTLSANRTGSS